LESTARCAARIWEQGGCCDVTRFIPAATILLSDRPDRLPLALMSRPDVARKHIAPGDEQLKAIKDGRMFRPM
jgi:hypothetical protein